MYHIINSEYTEERIKEICAEYVRSATVFIYNFNNRRNLAIDTQPDVQWGSHIISSRAIIGTFKPRDLYENVLPYARML